jgi:hypothetical protein
LVLQSFLLTTIPFAQPDEPPPSDSAPPVSASL